jgi:hypothetical protein
MSTTAVVQGRVECKPNISAAGERVRMRFGWSFLGVSAVALGGFVAARAAWPWRLLVGLPAALSAVGFLQVMRHTCVARAAEGTFEHEDLSKTPAPPAEVAASRRVAATIHRDTAIVGVLAAAIAAATALVR